MNWDAIGAIAETLGAVAVIVSIIYLAAQVRQTRLQLKAQTEDNITSRAFDAYSPIYEGNNAQIFRKGLESPADLDLDEAFLFKLLMDRQRGVFSTIVRRAHDGSISQEMATRLYVSYKKLFLETNGGKEWFAQARQTMSHLEIRALENTRKAESRD